MDVHIPKHHKRGEVCATRPAYREGRAPKAVKVYTVNNESQYILIQNVPSVGAKEELLKLCSTFGHVEDLHTLDEYPTEDKYTEVYLLKYKNINSARFAKRKLDDHSFFGGALHVCYAPEYESVAETRSKLQERRRAIASKIRQHYGETQRPIYKKHTHTQRHLDARHSMGTASMTQVSLDANPAHHGISHCDLHQDEPSLPIETTPAFSGLKNPTAYIDPLPPNSSQESSVAGENFLLSNENDTSESSAPYVTFDIPLPAKPSSKRLGQKNTKYEFARVRSHHASLPLGFTGSTAGDTTQPSLNKDKELMSIRTLPSDEHISEMSLRQEGEMTSQSTCTNVGKEKDRVVIRDYKISKPTLKFVPRQTVKRNADEAGHSHFDYQNKAIKKSAFILGDVQGPAEVPGLRPEKPKLTPGADDSYRDTISSIRSKISKVITDNVKPPQ